MIEEENNQNNPNSTSSNNATKSNAEATLSLEEREAKWGFSLDELKAASKVVSVLFRNPSLFVGDPHLADSRLYTMITRDRKTKRENREVYKQVMNEEKRRKDDAKRQQDIATIRKTGMKRERDEALNLLLLAPSPEDDDDDKNNEEGGEDGDNEGRTPRLMLLEHQNNKQSAARATATVPANAAAAANDKFRLRLLGAFENLLLLECELGTTSTQQQRNCLRIGHFTAQVYRFLPHDFGTQMPYPIVLFSSARNEFVITVTDVKKRICRELLLGSPPSTSAVSPFALFSAMRQNNSSRTPQQIRKVFCGLVAQQQCDETVSVTAEETAFNAHLQSFLQQQQDGSSSHQQYGSDDEISDALNAFVATQCYHLEECEGIPDAAPLVAVDVKAGPPISALATAGTTTAANDDGYEADELDTGEANNTTAAALHRKFQLAMCYATDVNSFEGTSAPGAAANLDRSGECDEDSGLQMNRDQKCHTCKDKYRCLHLYYYALCRPCGEFNYNKRLMTRDLRGKVVLLTGCRIKIGYAMALSLLRCGATLIGTTRFVHDGFARFQKEADYDVWKHRVHLYSLDLRDLWMVTQFCGFVSKHFPKLFAIVNNAAQTIARTLQYTESLRMLESNPPAALRDGVKRHGSTEEWRNFFLHNSSVTVGQSLQLEHHPEEHPAPYQINDATTTTGDAEGGSGGVATSTNEQDQRTSALVANNKSNGGDVQQFYDRYDTHAEAQDMREKNSWTMRLHEISGSEAAEVMTINYLSCFILNSKLKPLLLNREGDSVPNEGRFIINVSAMEGQFFRWKTPFHAHSNAAKAALNMMTRTSGADYAQDGIYMNSVDTGWITDESPVQQRKRRAEQFMLCPLDEVDAAARCLDLIYTNSTQHALFFKDFHTIAW